MLGISFSVPLERGKKNLKTIIFGLLHSRKKEEKLRTPFNESIWASRLGKKKIFFSDTVHIPISCSYTCVAAGGGFYANFFKNGLVFMPLIDYINQEYSKK